MSRTRQQPLRPLPLRLKRRARETDDSYLTRLLDLHHITAAARRRVDIARRPATEVLAILAPGHHLETPPEVEQRLLDEQTLAVGARWLCRRCAQGQNVELRAYFGGYVCLQHRMWTGPGTTPEAQYDVSDDVIRAELRFRRLHSRGRLDEYLYLAIHDAVEEQRAHGPDTAGTAAGRFAMAMRLIGDVILDQDLLHRLLNPALPFGEAYEALDAAVQECLGFASVVITDRAWQLLRPAAAALRGRLDGHPPPPAGRQPGHTLLRGYTPPAVIPQPLQPFDRFLTKRRSCAARRPHDDENAYLAALGGLSERPLLMCRRGHFQLKSLPLPRSARVSGGIGCPYCGNDKALPGYNTLRQTDADRLHEWHPTKNGSLTPDDVTHFNTRTLVWWRCVRGHEYQEVPNERLRRTTCPYCRHRRIVPADNSLAAARPDLAAQWHPTLNGETTPDQIGPGTPRVFHWLCPEGHAYLLSVERRTRSGSGCPTCRSHLLRPGSTLAEAHPELAMQLDPDHADPRQLRASSQKRVRWICPKGHRYLRSPYLQRKRTDCPTCQRQTRTKIHGRPGQTNWRPFAETHPQLREEWHPTLNAGLDPDDYGAGAHDIVWWSCPEGHPYQAALCNRSRRHTGCTVCTGKTIIPGVNDLLSQRPDIAAEWDLEANGDTTPDHIYVRTHAAFWWKCRKGHAFKQGVRERVNHGYGCAACSRRRIEPGFNDLATRYPELAAEWDTAQNAASPSTIGTRSTMKAHWLCANGHHTYTSVAKRIDSGGCAQCPAPDRAGGHDRLPHLGHWRHRQPSTT